MTDTKQKKKSEILEKGIKCIIPKKSTRYVNTAKGIYEICKCKYSTTYKHICVVK